MVAFAASCVGLLLFLWISFGGSLPLAPQGYRFSVEFDRGRPAGSAVRRADLRASASARSSRRRSTTSTGLTQGRDPDRPQYAPRPADTRAILRQKSLLGETYIELSPGSQNGAQARPTAARCRAARSRRPCSSIRSSRRSTRRPAQAFETWMQQEGIALTSRGQDFNAAFAELYPFATNVDSVLAVLHRDSAATSTLLRDGGQVFAALTARRPQLQGFVTQLQPAVRRDRGARRGAGGHDPGVPGVPRSPPRTTVEPRRRSSRRRPSR